MFHTFETTRFDFEEVQALHQDMKVPLKGMSFLFQYKLSVQNKMK